MKKKRLTEEALAKKTGQHRSLISRKRREGKSDEQIEQEATAKDAPMTDGGETFANAQARKERALANLRQLEYQQKRGQLIDVNEAASMWATIAQTLREAFMALPDRVSPELASITDAKQHRDRLAAEIRAVLTNLPAVLHAAVDAKGHANDAG